jgi:ABC-2 type transport system permease protein
MRRIYEVARREYLDTVRTRTFLLSVLFTPLLMGAIAFFGSRAARGGAPQRTRSVVVVDRTGVLGEEIEREVKHRNEGGASGGQLRLEVLETETADLAQVSAEQKQRLRDGLLDVYAVLDPDCVDGKGKIVMHTRGAKASEIDFLQGLKSLLNQAIIQRRCEQRGVSRQLLAELRRWAPVEQVVVEAGSTSERKQKESDIVAGMIVPFFFMFLMFMGVFGMSQHILTSVIEEKNSRIIEVLLSALSPFQLMAGKILGLAGIGLTVILLWALTAYTTARWRGITVVLPTDIIPHFVIFYILGFLLFSSVLAGIGSVCNTTKEAQSLMMPLTLVMILPMVGWMSIAREPSGTIARVLSFVPPVAPMVMILRLTSSLHVPGAEVFASILVLGASVPVTMWAASKVFRTGILLYGKRPTPTEMFRWIRQK